MARIRASGLLIVSLVVALAAPASRSLAQTTWTAELVDPNGAFEDAAWGPDGPAIAYVFSDSPTSPPSVKYAYRTDAWHVEEAVSSPYIFFIGADPLLAFDRNGDAWILYGQAFPQGSVLMHRTAPDTWETVKFIPNANGYDLQLAPDGSLAMLLQRDPYVVYATWDGHLRISRVARGRPGSIGFERDRAPAVAFESSGGISYALRFGRAWIISVVDDASNAAYDYDASLGFVSPNEPVIAYTQQVAGRPDSNLRLADRGPDGTWRTRPVDTGRKSGLSPSLAIGGVETIYIAYFRGGYDNPDLRLATHTPTFQEATTIFSGLFISPPYGSPRLVVDPGGVPHVAFVDGAGLEFGSPST